jgi:hypothetical protein
VDVSSHGLPGTDVPTDFIQMLQMAEMLSEAEMYMPPELRGKPADILALMFRARGMDIPLAVAWDELYATADGDVGRRAKLVRALARRAGHRIHFVERDRYHAVAVVHTADGEKHEVSFRIEEAVERGYTDPSYEYSDAWLKMPEDMLVARVTTRAVNWFCPEVLLGMGADLREHADDPQNASQVVEIREERRAQVNQVLRLVGLADRQPNGMVRLSLLRGLFMECRDAMLLDYATTPTQETSVRHVLVDAMRAADALAKGQSSGEAPTADPADGPQTLDDLRGLDEAETADAPADTAPEPEAAPEPEKKPRKRAAKKTTAKKASKTPDGTAPAAKAKGSARPRKAASKTQASAAPASPAARPAARSAARPDTDRLPCGCLVDHIISTGTHADACTDRQGGTQ